MTHIRTAAPSAQLAAEVVRQVVNRSGSAHLEINYVPSDGSMVMEFEELLNSEVLVFHVSPHGIITDHQIVTIDDDGTRSEPRSGRGSAIWTEIRSRGVRVFEEAV